MSSRSAIRSASSGKPCPEKSISRFSVVCVRWPLRIKSLVLRSGLLWPLALPLGVLAPLLRGSRGVPDHARRYPDGELARRDVLVDHASGAKVSSLPYCNRCYKIRIHPGEHAVFYSCPALVLAVVVGGDSPGPEVGALPDLSVSDVGEVRDLAPPPHPRVLDLAVGSDLRPRPEDGPRPQEGVGADARPLPHLRAPPYRMPHERPVAYRRIQAVCRRADDAVGTYLRDRKSTRLNSSHANISYAVFCFKKKKQSQH